MRKIVAVVVAFAALLGGGAVKAAPEPRTDAGTVQHASDPVAPTAPSSTTPMEAAAEPTTTTSSPAVRRPADRSGGARKAATTAPAVSTPLAPALLVSPGLRHYNAGRGLPVVIYLHGVFEDPAAPVFPELLQGIADAGYEVVFTDLGGPNTWGNELAMVAIDQLKATYSPTRPVRLVAGSMGGISLLNWAHAHPADVVAAVGIIPATNLHNVSLQHYIELASPDPHEPEQLVTVPYQVWYGTEDSVVGPPTVHGTLLELHAMPTGHTAGQPVDLAAVARFLRRG